MEKGKNDILICTKISSAKSEIVYVYNGPIKAKGIRALIKGRLLGRINDMAYDGSCHVEENFEGDLEGYFSGTINFDLSAIQFNEENQTFLQSLHRTELLLNPIGFLLKELDQDAVQEFLNLDIKVKNVNDIVNTLTSQNPDHILSDSITESIVNGLRKIGIEGVKTSYDNSSSLILDKRRSQEDDVWGRYGDPVGEV